MQTKKLVIAVAVLVASVMCVSPAWAYYKWSQTPDWYAGWDVLSYYDDVTGEIVADDFQCVDGNPVTDIHWWGSYESHNDMFEEWGTASPATDFWLGFWTDVPAAESDYNFSHPGTLLASYDIYDLIGYNDGWQEQAAHNGYKYEVDISNDPFLQEEGSIYWLSILAVDDEYPETEWGWKRTTTQQHWNDYPVRVSKLAEDIPEPQIGDDWLTKFGSYWIEDMSADQAFELTSTPGGVVPEPASMLLLGFGLMGLAGRRMRKRS